MFERTRRGAIATATGVLGALAISAAPAAADTASCAGSAKAANARVQVFKDANCGGPSVIVPKTGDGNRPDFAAFRNFDGTIRQVDNNRSSLAIDPGTCVRLFDGKSYTGTASTNICAGGGVLFWNLNRFNDRASSMRVCPTSKQADCNAPGATAPAPAPGPAPAPAPAGSIQAKAVAWAMSKAGTRECHGEQPGWVKATFPRGRYSSCTTSWCGIFIRQAYRAANIELGAIASVDTIYGNAKANRSHMRLIPVNQIKTGDLVLMWFWRDGKQGGRTANHVAMARGNYAGGSVPTVEGNISDKVTVTTRNEASRDSHTGRRTVVFGVRIS